jgi:hypothetical protein
MKNLFDGFLLNGIILVIPVGLLFLIVISGFIYHVINKEFSELRIKSLFIFRRKFSLIGMGIIMLCPMSGNGNSISINHLNPASAAKLNFGEEISVSFNYNITEPGGARIFIRPLTGTILTPNYAASGSPVYTGNGNATATFTIKSGETEIDKLRIQVFNSSQSELLFEFNFPVSYQFTAVVKELKLSEQAIKPDPRRPNRKIQRERVEQVQDNKKNRESSGPTGTKKILPDGSVEISFPDGKIVRKFKGGMEIYDPKTKQSQIVLYSTGARPPIPPSLPDDAGLIWMESHSENLLNIIRSLINHDPVSIENYLQYEGEKDIYNKILLREETISYMVQS